MARILIVDDEDGVRTFLAECLELSGHEVDQAESGERALALINARSFELVITDLRMPGMTGLQLIEQVQVDQPELEFIVLTAFGNVDTAVAAMKMGAFDFVQKPLSGPTEIRLMAERALERRALRDHRERTREPSVAPSISGPRLSYGDPAMAPVVHALRRVAATDATVLLLGDSGTGKEVAARAVHGMSGRRDGPFVAVNCATLGSHLLESELFGHEKGAFTGATQRKRGRLELAHGGSFFLDEIAELNIELQAKLLRVLQERSFERVGGTRSIEVDVRWIAATNRDLHRRIDDGLFRADLYHRVSVFPVRLPALRERSGDIIPLAESLLKHIARDLKRTELRLDPAVHSALQKAPWPGNIRELANVLERAAILTDGPVIGPEHLLLDPVGARVSGQRDHSVGDAPMTLEALEVRAIRAALAAVDGNRRKAAERLGIGLRTLYDKLKRHRIE